MDTADDALCTGRHKAQVRCIPCPTSHRDTFSDGLDVALQAGFAL